MKILNVNASIGAGYEGVVDAAIGAADWANIQPGGPGSSAVLGVVLRSGGPANTNAPSGHKPGNGPKP